MEVLFPIILVGWLFWSFFRKAVKNEEAKEAARRNQAPPRPQGSRSYSQGTAGGASVYNRPQTAPRNYRSSAAPQRDGRVYASIDFDNIHYHAEGFDFDCCISFKGLPQGTDELAVLIASNTRHERELQRLLHTNEKALAGRQQR